MIPLKIYFILLHIAKNEQWNTRLSNLDNVSVDPNEVQKTVTSSVANVSFSQIYSILITHGFNTCFYQFICNIYIRRIMVIKQRLVKNNLLVVIDLFEISFKIEISHSRKQNVSIYRIPGNFRLAV